MSKDSKDSKDVKIGIPGGLIYQLWYLLDGLNQIYIEE